MDLTNQAPEIRLLTTAAEATDEVLAWAEQVFTDWFDNDGPIDWEDFADRFADPYGRRSDDAEPFDLEQLDTPFYRKVQRHVRAYKNS
jgi:hypothetical protein